MHILPSELLLEGVPALEAKELVQIEQDVEQHTYVVEGGKEGRKEWMKRGREE